MKKDKYIPLYMGSVFIACHDLMSISFRIKNIFHSQMQRTKEKNYFGILADFFRIEKELINDTLKPQLTPLSWVPQDW